MFGSPKRIFDKFCTESIAVVRRSGWLPKEFEFLGFFADWGLQMFSRISKTMPPAAPDRKTRNNVNIFSTPNGVPFGGDLQVGTSSSYLKIFKMQWK